MVLDVTGCCARVALWGCPKAGTLYVLQRQQPWHRRLVVACLAPHGVLGLA